MLSALGWIGCIDSPADAEACYWVEQQRCELRGRCYSGFDVEGCQYYYREQCRARNIVPDYTDDQMDACLLQIASFGNDSAECELLINAEKGKKLELCTIESLAACRPIACEEYFTDDTDTTEAGSTDTSVSEGLEPSM
jgi:hypothetical protein